MILDEDIAGLVAVVSQVSPRGNMWLCVSDPKVYALAEVAGEQNWQLVVERLRELHRKRFDRRSKMHVEYGCRIGGQTM